MPLFFREVLEGLVNPGSRKTSSVRPKPSLAWMTASRKLVAQLIHGFLILQSSLPERFAGDR